MTKESGDSKVAAVKDLTQSSEKLAHEGWKATAGSEEGSGNDGPASWAIDGNTGTIWHSRWSSGGTHPDIANDQNNEFTIDFGQNVTINKFEYVPRFIRNFCKWYYYKIQTVIQYYRIRK